MARSLTAGMLAATQAQVCHPIVFIQVNTTGGNVYMWTGFGNFLWNGQTWIGVGNALGIGPVTEQNRVMAAGATLTLSGINQSMIALVLEDLARYLPCLAWLGAVDDNYQLINSPYQFLNGRIDTAKIQISRDTATIIVSAESRLIAMRQSKVRRYTDQDQRLDHPGDAGFSFVDTLQDATINFHG